MKFPTTMLYKPGDRWPSRILSPFKSAGVEHEAATLGSLEAAGEVLPSAHTVISNLKA